MYIEDGSVTINHRSSNMFALYVAHYLIIIALIFLFQTYYVPIIIRSKSLKEKKQKSEQLLVYSNRFECLNENLPSNSEREPNRYYRNNYVEQFELSTETVKQEQLHKKIAKKFEDKHHMHRSGCVSIKTDSEDGNKKSAISFALIHSEQKMHGLEEEVSSLTRSTNITGEHSEEMMTAIKGLDMKFELFKSRISEISELRLSRSSILNQIKNTHNINEVEKISEQVEKLSYKNKVLEETNRHLSDDLKKRQLGDDLETLDRDYEIQRQKLNAIVVELHALKAVVENYKEKNNALVTLDLPSARNEFHNPLNEIGSYQKYVDHMCSKLEEYEKNMLQIKTDKKAYTRNCKDAIRQNLRTQKLELEKKYTKIFEIKQVLDSTRKELNETLLNSKNLFKQLKVRTIEKEKIEKELCEFKQHIVLGDKNNTTAIKVVQKQRDGLKNQMQTLEKELSAVRKERLDNVLRLKTFDQREEALRNRLLECDRVRKELHSRVMVLIGNIRVFVRVRPILQQESEELLLEEKQANCGTDAIFKFAANSREIKERCNSKYGCDDPAKNILEVVEPYKDRGGLSQRQKKWSFGFDNVFKPSHTQQELWEASEPLIQSCIDGFNVTLIAYGQTGSGKTFTMLGSNDSLDNEGIISRSIRKLFDAKAQIEDISYGVKNVSMSVELLEVYNEKIIDLLANKKPDSRGDQVSLKIVSNKVVGSTQLNVTNLDEIKSTIANAQKRRTVKSTASNATSSRSHLLFTIEFCVTSNDESKQVGKLRVCDLAGSERLSKSAVQGATLKETQHINLSLSTLSSVIEKLQKGERNVNFRDSSLTNILKDSLVGNSKTLCIICLNPLLRHFHETLCSLRFAAKINKVNLKSTRNFTA